MPFILPTSLHRHQDLYSSSQLLASRRHSNTPSISPSSPNMGFNIFHSKKDKTPEHTASNTPASTSAAPHHPNPTAGSSRAMSGSSFNPFASRGSKQQPTRRPAPAAAATPSDAPPEYSPPIASATDDPYAFLASFDTIFLIDDSGSMAGRSWAETSTALQSITPICTEHDADGIDVYFLNAPDNPEYRNLQRATDVQAIFNSVRPRGGTPTGSRLNAILKPYLRRVETEGCDNVKPLNIIVITDGVPSDDVESVILAVARKLDRWDAPAWQVGIQFFQVGREPGAAEALQELDDELAEMGCGTRDIVDTVPWNGSSGSGLNSEGILKVVLGAVNRRLDRQNRSHEWRR